MSGSSKMHIKILHHKYYFGQSLPTFKSMDLSLLESRLNSYGFQTSLITFEELQFEDNEENCYYLCGSHQNIDVKAYLDDVLDLPNLSGKIIPSRRLIKAHENKGFQGLIANSKGAPFESQEYFVEIKSIEEKKVIKLINGAGSGGVVLCNRGKELNKFIVFSSLMKIGLIRAAYFIRAKLNCLLRKNFSLEALDYYKPKERYVIQDFVPNLSCDYKVLVFMDKCFVLKRNVRKDDFRASGSGLFEFIEAPTELLDFSFNFRGLIGTPYISMDVIEKGNGEFSCIEFQCVHFGPYTQMESDYYYLKEPSGWKVLKNDTVLEDLIAYSVKRFLV